MKQLKNFSKHNTILMSGPGRYRGRRRIKRFEVDLVIHVLGPGPSLGFLLDLDDGTVGGQQQTRDGAAFCKATRSTLVGTITPALTRSS